MDLPTALIKLGIPALKKAYENLKGALSKQQQEKCISEAIMELLGIYPDIDAV